jgi:uncharacterized protein (DUF2132 family)
MPRGGLVGIWLYLWSIYQLNRQDPVSEQPNNPLHGKTLEAIVTELVDRYGWAELAKRIPINCFRNDPSIKSSLAFLRRTAWAREQVETLYIKSNK